MCLEDTGQKEKREVKNEDLKLIVSGTCDGCISGPNAFYLAYIQAREQSKAYRALAVHGRSIRSDQQNIRDRAERLAILFSRRAAAIARNEEKGNATTNR